METKKTDSCRAFHHGLRRMMHTHHAVCEKRISTLGIHPAQHMLLMHLAHHEHIPSQKELAADMHVSPAALAVSLGKLEAGGYVQKAVKKDDCRTKTISITARGREVVRRSCAIFDEIDSEMFAGVPEELLCACITLLERAYENLKEMKEGAE